MEISIVLPTLGKFAAYIETFIVWPTAPQIAILKEHVLTDNAFASQIITETIVRLKKIVELTAKFAKPHPKPSVRFVSQITHFNQILHAVKINDSLKFKNKIISFNI